MIFILPRNAAGSKRAASAAFLLWGAPEGARRSGGVREAFVVSGGKESVEHRVSNEIMDFI